MSDFYRTNVGRRFYGETMPRIADALERLAGVVEAMVAELKRQRGANPESTTTRGARTYEVHHHYDEQGKSVKVPVTVPEDSHD